MSRFLVISFGLRCERWGDYFRYRRGEDGFLRGSWCGSRGVVVDQVVPIRRLILTNPANTGSIEDRALFTLSLFMEKIMFKLSFTFKTESCI